ncbi:MAG: peptidase, partial [Odoribacteraceae bacterium]|nr:peptidase [Odoribacteraceae bacterium]
MSPFRLILPLLLPACALAQQPRAMTDKFFPEPGIEIHTPSFQKKRGVASIDETLAYIRATVEGHPVATCSFIGKTRGGREIPAVILRRENDTPKTRVLLLARIHGDEPAGTEALLYFLHRVLDDPAVNALLDRLDVALLPFLNIDGGEKLRRELDGGLDMNRDMTKLLAPETIALHRFATGFAPDVVLDLHEYHPFRADYARLASFGACAAPDVMLLHSDNLNNPPALGQLTGQVFLPSIHRALADEGMTSHAYFTSRREAGDIIINLGGDSPRSSSTSFALRGALSILAEIRGAGFGRISFKRRILASYTVLLAVLRDAYRHADALRDAIADVGRDSIVVTTTRPVSRRP